MRQFNVSGPCRPEIHYMLPPLRRLPTLRGLIEAQGDFSIRAPRDAGKTTAALGLARLLTLEGRFAAVSLSLSTAAAFPHDIGAAEAALVNAWHRAARRQLPPELAPPPFPEAPPGCRIGTALELWAGFSSRPLVVILDDWEMVQGATLVSVVSQLQEGISGRPEAFPWSIGLVGLDESTLVGSREHLASDAGRRMPNLKLESVRLPDFTHDEIEVLCAQHTADTGQLFRREAVDRLFELTGGRPLAVNSIARYIVQTLLRETTLPVGAGHVELASEFAFERWEEGSRASSEVAAEGGAAPSWRTEGAGMAAEASPLKSYLSRSGPKAVEEGASRVAGDRAQGVPAGSDSSAAGMSLAGARMNVSSAETGASTRNVRPVQEASAVGAGLLSRGELARAQMRSLQAAQAFSREMADPKPVSPCLDSFMSEDGGPGQAARIRESAVSNAEPLPEVWLRSDGRLDTDRLLEAFLVFWRRLGSPLQRTTPHIIFRTFLQRVVQGSGALEREYFSGRGAIDVMLRYGGETLPIQLRIWRDGERDPLSESLQQLDQYLVDADIVSGWIIIFDRRMAARSLLERTSTSLINSLSRRRVRLIRA